MESYLAYDFVYMSEVRFHKAAAEAQKYFAKHKLSPSQSIVGMLQTGRNSLPH